MHLRYTLVHVHKQNNRFSQQQQQNTVLCLKIFQCYSTCIRETTQKAVQVRIGTYSIYACFTRKYTTNFPNSQLRYFSSAFKSKKKKRIKRKLKCCL